MNITLPTPVSYNSLAVYDNPIKMGLSNHKNPHFLCRKKCRRTPNTPPFSNAVRCLLRVGGVCCIDDLAGIPLRAAGANGLRTDCERGPPATMVGGPRRRRFISPSRPLATIQTLAKWPKNRGLDWLKIDPFTGGRFIYLFIERSKWRSKMVKQRRSAGALVFSLTACRRTRPGSHKSMHRCRCLLIKITVVLIRATAGLVAMVLGGMTCALETPRETNVDSNQDIPPSPPTGACLCLPSHSGHGRDEIVAET